MVVPTGIHGDNQLKLIFFIQRQFFARRVSFNVGVPTLSARHHPPRRTVVNMRYATALSHRATSTLFSLVARRFPAGPKIFLFVTRTGKVTIVTTTRYYTIFKYEMPNIRNRFQKKKIDSLFVSSVVSPLHDIYANTCITLVTS